MLTYISRICLAVCGTFDPVELVGHGVSRLSSAAKASLASLLRVQKA
jgi:hypothetical protein